MTPLDTTALERMGLDAARSVAGDDAVEQVEVVPGYDRDERPVYRFSFLIDQDRARQRAGLVRVRIIQRLLDELIARDDEHQPVIQVLNRADWPLRRRA